jgi:hypothetical protein
VRPHGARFRGGAGEEEAFGHAIEFSPRNRATANAQATPLQPHEFVRGEAVRHEVDMTTQGL